MNDGSLFPAYIPRPESERIQQIATEVRDDGRSRVVLLYGPGGIGKTMLVRELPSSAADENVIWIEPIDADDSEYWLLSNLERKIAQRLDPDYRYFGPYEEYLSRLPRFTRSHIDHEAVVSHLARINMVFVHCYE